MIEITPGSLFICDTGLVKVTDFFNAIRQRAGQNRACSRLGVKGFPGHGHHGRGQRAVPRLPVHLRQARAVDLGLVVSPEHTAKLTALGREIKWALNGHPAAHLADPRLSGVYGTILVDDLGRTPTGPWQRNVTVFADGEVDRSPVDLAPRLEWHSCPILARLATTSG